VEFRLLSYSLDEETPTYGNKNRVKISSGKSLANGDSVNESSIDLPLHSGTHIDFPKHFYLDGQTLQDYPVSFWVYNSPLLVEVEAKNLLLKDEVIEKLNRIPEGTQADILLIKVKNDVKRHSSTFWKYNYGLHPDLAQYIRVRLPDIRSLGINSISLSSFQHRNEGRKAHLEFLSPENPILIIEDMNLSNISVRTKFKKIIVLPLQVNNVDGVPVSILAELY
jgi:arylformamidase